MSTQVSTMPPGILSKGPAATGSGTNAGVEAWVAVGWIGIALATIGWSDLILGLYPYKIGNPDWEFGAIGNALNSMPLGALGIGVAIASAVARSKRVMLTVLGVISVAIVVFLAVCAVVYALSLPIVIKSVPVQVRDQINLVVLKVGVLWVIYTALFSVLGRYALSVARSLRKARA